MQGMRVVEVIVALVVWLLLLLLLPLLLRVCRPTLGSNTSSDGHDVPMGEPTTVVSPSFPFVALRLLVDDELVDLTLLFSTFSCTCSFRRDDRQLGVEGLPLSQRFRGCLSGVDDDFLVEFCAMVAFESTFTPSLPCRGGVPIAVKSDESEYNNNECWGGGERERM